MVESGAGVLKWQLWGQRTKVPPNSGLKAADGNQNQTETKIRAQRNRTKEMRTVQNELWLLWYCDRTEAISWRSQTGFC